MDPVKKQHLQSLLVLGGTLIVTLSIGFLPASWFGITTTTAKYKKLDLGQPASLQDVAQDTNNDGKIGWNELISQTGGVKTDSAENIPADPQLTAALNDPNNLTTSLSKNLYVSSAYMKQYGQADATTESDVVTKLLANESSKLAVTTYTYNDLVIEKSESDATRKAYGNKLGSIITTGIESGLGFNDIDALQLYIKKDKDPSALATLKEKSASANTITLALSKMSVPPSAAPFHLVLLTRVALYSNMMEDISHVDTDPVRASIAFKQYAEITGMMLQSIPTIVEYFVAQDVVFSKKDPGYIFSPGYTAK